MTSDARANTPTPTAEQLRLIQQARHASLLKMWTAGRKLNLSEMAEISHLLPAEVLAAGPEIVAAAKTLHSKLQHEQAWYADFYKRDVRIIKRWLKRGREKNDPAPLDDPAAMVKWWGRCMSYSVPDIILTLAQAIAPAAPAPALVPLSATADPSFRLESDFGAGQTPADESAVAGSVDLSSLQVGSGMEVRQAASLATAAYKKLEDAYRLADEDKIRLWSRTWKEANQEYRRAILAEKDMQKARGNLLPLLEATQDWTTLLEVFRTVRRSLFKRIRLRLPALAAEDLESIRVALEAEQAKEDHVFRTIRHIPSLSDVDAELTPT